MTQLLIPELEITPPQDGDTTYSECSRCGGSHDRITKILDQCVPKFALVHWAENVGRAAGWKAARAGVGAEGVKEWASEEGLDCETAKLAGGSRGTALHQYLEAFVESGTPAPLSDLDPEHRPYGTELAKFLLAYEPEFLASEILVANCDLNYAGKFDGIAVIGAQPPRRNKPVDLTGKRVLFDLKTSKDGRTYMPAQGLQVAAYEAAWRSLGGEPNEHQIIVAVGESSYQVKVSPFEPEVAAAGLMGYYNMLQEQQGK